MPLPFPIPSIPASRLRPGAGAVAWLLAWGLLVAALATPAPGVPSPAEPAPAATEIALPEEAALPGEFYRATAPHLALARQTVRRGEWPLWNDRAGTGYPLLGTAGGQLLHPFTALVYPLPTAAWLPLLAWLRIATGLGLATWLLRRLGARPVSALAAGVAYGAAVATLAAHPGGTYAALAPGLLLVAEGRRQQQPRGAFLFVAFAALFAGGDPPAIALGILFATAFLVVRAAPLPPARRRRRLGAWVAWGGLAALVTAPILATTFRWYPHTSPARRFARQRLTRLTSDPLELEQGLGMTSRAVDLDLLRGPEPLSTAALGLALILVAATAWWAGRRREGTADETRVGVPASFPTPFFVALGLAAWLEVARPPGISSLLEYYRLPPAAELAAAPGLPWLLLALVVLATAAARRSGHRLADRLGYRRGAASVPIPRRHLVALGVVAALLLTLLPVLRTPTPPRHPELMDRLQALQRDTGYSRVAVLGASPPPESLGPHGLSDVRGHPPYLPAAYVDLLRWLTPAQGEQGEGVTGGTLSVHHSPLYRLLGVRYKVTPPWSPTGEPKAAPGRPVAHLAEASLFESPDALPLLFLPRQVRTRPAPDGWVRWVRTNRDFGHRSLAPPPRRDLKPVAAADGEEVADRGRAGDGEHAGNGELRLVEIHATRLQAQVRSDRRRLVAGSVFQDGGWRALVSQAGTSPGAVPTTLANGPFVAVWMPPGSYRLDLLYRPPGFAAALAVSALGLALALTLLVPAPRRIRARVRREESRP